MEFENFASFTDTHLLGEFQRAKIPARARLLYAAIY